MRIESGTRDVAWVADQCRAFFGQCKVDRKPFHLTVGVIDPHRDTQTRVGFGNHEEQVGNRIHVPEVNPEDFEIPHWISDLPETRQEFAEYYCALTRVDTGVPGLILDALKAKGLEDSTLMIITSDTGAPFINSKTTLCDSGVGLPLLVCAPGSPGGLPNSNTVSFIDLLPKMLDYAALPANYSTPTSTSPARLGPLFPAHPVKEIYSTASTTAGRRLRLPHLS